MACDETLAYVAGRRAVIHAVIHAVMFGKPKDFEAEGHRSANDVVQTMDEKKAGLEPAKNHTLRG
jgi:hypothetical protein